MFLCVLFDSVVHKEITVLLSGYIFLQFPALILSQTQGTMQTVPVQNARNLKTKPKIARRQKLTKNGRLTIYKLSSSLCERNC